jgi:hypothetical protein
VRKLAVHGSQAKPGVGGRQGNGRYLI